jgi:hypothetical protein
VQASRTEHVGAGGDALIGLAFALGGAQLRLARLRLGGCAEWQSGGDRGKRSGCE